MDRLVAVLIGTVGDECVSVQQYEKRSVEGAQEKVTTRAGQLHRTVVETNSK